MTPMYLSYFGLAEARFHRASAAYLYMSQRHQDALAHLLYGVNGEGGFVLLTGESGPARPPYPAACSSRFRNPATWLTYSIQAHVEELLSTICVEFGIACPPGNTSIKVFVDCINAHLLDAHANGKHSVLIIDEAQNLSADVLEQMRLLTNLETNERKLLQIILIGQPSWRRCWRVRNCGSLRSASWRAITWEAEQDGSRCLCKHRLGVAARNVSCSSRDHERLHQLSGGIPRIINVLCDRALLGTYAQGKERVDRATLEQAAREVFHQPSPQRRNMLRFLRPA